MTAGKRAVAVAIGLAGRYATETFKKSVRRELTDAMLTALRSAAPPAGVDAEMPKRGPAKTWRARRRRARARRAANKKAKKQSKRLLKDQQVSADAAAVAVGSRKSSSDDWRTELARQLSKAASDGLTSSDVPTRKTWMDLMGSPRDSQEWAETVSVEFALQIRARKKLEFLVVQLDRDDERARLMATTAAFKGVANAVYGVSISLLIGAGGIALALH